MAMELSETNVSACKVMSGGEIENLAAGKTIKIETSPEGEEILEETVPAGKAWEVRIYISITETDA